MQRWLVCGIAIACGCERGAVSSADAECGPGSASERLVAMSDQFALTYTSFVAEAGTACPGATGDGSPSLTIIGTQSDGTGRIAFCADDANALEHTAWTLGVGMNVEEVTGTSNACTFSLDPSTAPVGVTNATGVCNAGTSEAGFRFIIIGRVLLTRTCAGITDTTFATLEGSVAVSSK